jgi:hypothetical protein
MLENLITASRHPTFHANVPNISLPTTILNHMNVILHSHLCLGMAGGFYHYRLQVLWILDKFFVSDKDLVSDEYLRFMLIVSHILQ